MNNEMPELPKENEVNNQEVQEVQPNQEENKVSETIQEVKENTVKELELSGKFFKDVRKYLTSKSSSELFSLLWRLIIIVGFIVLLYFPVQIIMDLGINFFMLLGIEYTTRVATIWTSIWNILYGVGALILFYSLCKDRFYKLVKPNEKLDN